MSEQAPNHGELFKAPEQSHSPEHAPKVTAEKQGEHITKPNTEAIRHSVDKEARSTAELQSSHSEKAPATSQHLVDAQLKDIKLARLLTSVRKQLNAPDKLLSRVVHAKAVETVSAAAEKTVARPIGLLGGGISALLGSSYVFYMARHYGFRYNFLLFILLFIGGYLVFSILELVFRVVTRTKYSR